MINDCNLFEVEDEHDESEEQMETDGDLEQEEIPENFFMHK